MVDARVAQEVVEDAGEGDCGCVAAGEDEGDRCREDLEVGHKVWVVTLGLQEAREEVDAVFCLFRQRGVEVPGREFGHFGLPGRGLFRGEDGGGVANVPEVEAGEEHFYGVFVADGPVEPGLLADLDGGAVLASGLLRLPFLDTLEV